ADSLHARLGAQHQGRSDVLGDPLPRVGAFLHWLPGLRLHRHAPVARRAGENRRGPRGGTVSILAYHFVNNTLRDGRPVPADGVWLEHDGPIAICKSGLHASRRPWHALAYAPGPVLCMVEVEGIAAEHDDKLVARRRRIVCRVDLTDDLRAFAR